MLNASLINPYIRVAMHSTIPAHREIKRRIIFDYELIYIADGEFLLTYNHVEYLCKKGDFLLLRPNIPHQFSKIEADLTQPHIHFDITHVYNSEEVPVSFKDINKMSDKEKAYIRENVFYDYPETPFISFSNQEKALRLFYEIIDNKTTILTQKAKFIQLFEMLIFDNFPNILKNRRDNYPIEEQIKNYIDAGQGLLANLTDISKQFNYSKYYIDRCFKTRYGVSIMAYKNEIRLQRAKTMLKFNTVSFVSEKLGFSSIYVFSRAFKNRFGIAPSNIAKAE